MDNIDYVRSLYYPWVNFLTVPHYVRLNPLVATGMHIANVALINIHIAYNIIRIISYIMSEQEKH